MASEPVQSAQAHLGTNISSDQLLPALEGLHVIDCHDRLLCPLSDCKQLLVGGQHDGCDAITLWCAGDEPVRFAIAGDDGNSVSSWVHIRAVLKVVQVVFDVALEAEHEPAQQARQEAEREVLTDAPTAQGVNS